MTHPALVVELLRQDVFDRLRVLVQTGQIEECTLIVDVATGRVSYVIDCVCISQDDAARKYLVT